MSQRKLKEFIEKVEQLTNFENITTENENLVNEIVSHYQRLSNEEKEALNENIKHTLQKITEKQRELKDSRIKEFLQIAEHLPVPENITLDDKDTIYNAIDKMSKIQHYIYSNHTNLHEEFLFLVETFFNLQRIEIEKQLPNIDTLKHFDYRKIYDIVEPIRNEQNEYYRKISTWLPNKSYTIGQSHFDKIRQLEKEYNQNIEKTREENKKHFEKMITNFETIVNHLPNADQITLKDEEKFKEATYNCLELFSYTNPEIVAKTLQCPELKDANETISSRINTDIVKKYLAIEEKIHIFNKEVSDLSTKILNFPEHLITLSDEAKINELKSQYDKLASHQKEKIQEKEKRKLQFLWEEIKKLKNNNTKTTSNSGGGGASFVWLTTPITTTQSLTQINTRNKPQIDTWKIFPNFILKKEASVTSLTDIKLLPLQQQFNAATEATRNQALTRGEFLQIILDSAKVNVNNTDINSISYNDLNKNHYMTQYIAFATNNKIVSGYSDNTFRPNAPISRAEATKILVNSLNIDLANTQNQFTDISSDNTLGIYIQTAFNLKLLNGTSATTFEPNRTISRGELIKIIYNILN